MHNDEAVTDSLLDGGEDGTLEAAVTARAPDEDVPEEELEWWLGVQERLETRAELADAGLL